MKQFNELTTECFAIYDTYGKSAHDLGVYTRILAKRLDDLPADKVIAAMNKWLDGDGKGLPKPADIRAIVNPEPKADYNVYNSLSTRLKKGEFLSDKEHRYLEWYSNKMMENV